MNAAQITTPADDIAAHTWLPDSTPIGDLLPILRAEDLEVRRATAPDGTPLVEVTHRDRPDKPLISMDATDALTAVGMVVALVGAMHVRDGAA